MHWSGEPPNCDNGNADNLPVWRLFRPEAAGERPSHEGGATTTAEVKAQGPPQSAGPCEAVMEPQFAKAAWWTYILQKTEHTDRRSQRGQCEDKY